MKPKRKERLHISLIPIIALFVLLNTGQVLYDIQNTITGEIYESPGGEIGNLTPDNWNLPYEDVSFQVEEDLTVRGWFIGDERISRAIILVPGRGTNRWDILEHGPVSHLLDNRFNILMFDPRTTGESDGDIYGFGFFTSRDILKAIEFLREEKNIEQVGVWGASAGASAAILAGLETDEISAIVADSPYANLRMVASSYGEQQENELLQVFFPLYMGVARLALNFDLYQKTDLSTRIRDLSTPLFLIHGSEDKALGPLNSQMLYENTGGPKRIWLPEGAWHVGAHEIYPEKYQRKVTAFFDSYMD